MSETQAERRSTINHELFTITDEMKVAMEKARMRHLDSFPDVKDADCADGNNNFRAYDQNQSFFITVTKDKFLEAGHPAAIIDTIIERLDLAILYKHYSKEGDPAYHPEMMLKVLFYGYYTGTMSCRTIWDSVINRSDFMHMAIDGQKIEANANYKNSKNLKGIKKEYAKVKEGMEKLLDKEVNEYFTEDTKKKRVSALEKKRYRVIHIKAL